MVVFAAVTPVSAPPVALKIPVGFPAPSPMKKASSSFAPILLPNSLEIYCSILNTLSFKSSSETLIKVSDELLNDSVFNIEQYISREFGRRIGAKEEEAFFIGDGAGKPTGIFNATGGAETGVTAANTTITFDDVMDLYYSLRAPYRNKAVRCV